MSKSIKRIDEYKIALDGWEGFVVVIPNGTNIRRVNEFLGEVMDWTVEVMKQGSTSCHHINRVHGKHNDYCGDCGYFPL